MHRFRRKSDKSSPHSPPQSPPSASASATPPSYPLAALPSDNDFRTSLILPSLSNRFTLLRTTSGDPVSLNDMRSKFADQRAKGAEWQISEEEEHQIIEQLSEIRATNAKTSELKRRPSDLLSNDGSSYYPDSEYTTSFSPMSSPILTPSSPPSSMRRQKSPAGLFSSSQARDADVFRRQVQRTGSGKSGVSDSTFSDSRSVGDDTMEGLQDLGSTSDYYSDKTPLARKLNLPASASSSATANARANQFKRISQALSNVIREIEEEGILGSEENARGNPPARSLSPRIEDSSSLSATALNGPDAHSDQTPSASISSLPNHSRSDSRSGAVSPRIRGYIPGMPRPVTPRDTDSDGDSRPLSVTPRAQSPSLPQDKNYKPQGILRRGSSSVSTGNQGLPRSDSPATQNGRFHGRQPSGDHYGPVSTFKSSLHERRRPASPLSSLAHSGNPQSYFSDIESPSPTAGHSRQSSMNGYEQYAGTHARSNSVARSLLSPALPDSPMLNSSHNSFTNYAPSGIPDTVSVPTIDLGSPGRNGRSFGYQYTHSKSASSPGVSEYDHNAFASHRRSPKPHTSNGSAYTSHAYSQSLILSPILNSSQSSLLSTGSSYHSTTESSRKASDAAFSMMRDSSSSSQTSPGLFDEDAQDDKPPETVNRKQMDYGDALRFFGLTPEYIAAFQEKLLHAASPDLVLAPRTPSLRRRTNSINDRLAYSSGNMAHMDHSSPTPSHKSHNSQSRAALLDSVLNSIELSTTPPSTKPHTPDPSNGIVGEAPSVPLAVSIANLEQAFRDDLAEAQGNAGQEDNGITTRSASRLQDLADAIFGSGPSDDAVEGETKETEATPTTQQADEPEYKDSAPEPREELENEQSSEEQQWREDLYSPYDAGDGPSKGRSEFQPTSQVGTSEAENSTSHASQPSVNDHQLLLDIGRKAAEATAALKSPSHVDLTETTFHRRKKGRRVEAASIGQPMLLSSSAQVNTFTIYSPTPEQAPASITSTSTETRPVSRISKGMKRLRGTLKVKKEAKQGEAATYVDASSRPSMEQSPDGSFTANQSVANLHDSDYYNVPHPSNQSTISIGSPPASSGIKGFGFLDRLRRGRRENSVSEATTSPPVTLGRSASTAVTGNARRPNTAQSQHLQLPSSPIYQQQSAPAFVQSFSNVTGPAMSSPEERSDDDVRKLLELGKKLGLPEAELSHLVFRSPSVASKTNQYPLSRSASATNRGASSSSSQLNSSVGSLDRPQTARPATATHQTNDSPPFDTSNGQGTVKRTRSAMGRKGSVKKHTEHRHTPEPTRPMEPHTEEKPAVIRRTLIFPAEGQHRQELVELEGLIRKTSRHRRSVGAGSIMSSTKSVHERAPTPPPPRSKRFSTDRSSPVPPVPGSDVASHLSVPRSKAYDSVYDMYGDSDLSQNLDDSVSASETGPVLQVLELANGETIWSIVNDLRSGSTYDGDDMSTFNRQSFASEFSTGSPSASVHEAGGMQLRFKEHKRTSSKSSYSATSQYGSALRKKTVGIPINRPETKVFYSSSAQIGRLVESLSKGIDSGSFNVVPINEMTEPTATSSVFRGSTERGRMEDGVATPVSFHSENSIGLTMEERVERMLNNLEAASHLHAGAHAQT